MNTHEHTSISHTYLLIKSDPNSTTEFPSIKLGLVFLEPTTKSNLNFKLRGVELKSTKMLLASLRTGGGGVKNTMLC